MRLGICFLCIIFLPVTTTAQSLDSVVLDQVMVYGFADDKYLTGSETQTLDSVLGAQYPSSHLGELLSFQVPVYFRNYGNGMISSITMRGTAPHHTSVLWNGLAINSFSLGQTDFSLLPGVAFEEVKVHAGGGSAMFGSGALGGSVLLSSASEVSKPLSLIQEIASFGKVFSALKGGVSRGRFDFSTTAYRHSAKNNFPIPDTDRRQNHAACTQQGITQDISWHLSPAQTISVHYWLHDSDREIQPTIGQRNSQDEQQDRNHRLLIQYRRMHSLQAFTGSAAFVDDVIVFNGEKSEIRRWTGKVQYQKFFRKGLWMQLTGDWNHILAYVENYTGGRAEEDRQDLSASFQKDISEKLSVSANFRQPLVSGITTPFLPYLGAQYAFLRNERKEFGLRVNGSKNFRAPTFNERYWIDAGTSDLLPETSYAAEAGMFMRIGTARLDVTAFTQEVDNWIQWVPDERGSYRPRNIKEVTARGVEVHLQGSRDLAGGRMFFNAAWQYTSSVTTKAPANEEYSLGKQLMYTPMHTASAYLSFTKSKWTTAASLQANGKRFTETSNSEIYALPFFALADCSLSRSFIFDRHRFDVRVSIKNIFDVEYQLYSGRAQPGRNYALQLVYQLNKTK